jgi:hypothetical protein
MYEKCHLAGPGRGANGDRLASAASCLLLPYAGCGMRPGAVVSGVCQLLIKSGLAFLQSILVDTDSRCAAVPLFATHDWAFTGNPLRAAVPHVVALDTFHE